MSLTLATARTEFRARGFEYLYDGTTTRIDYYLNRAYQELCGEENWPFLETTATGPAPLTISSLRSVSSVIDTTTQRKLYPLSREALTDLYPDTTTAGTPQSYRISGGDTIVTYPTSTDSLTVQFYKVPADLVTGTDIPLMPARFHLGIIDGAAAFAYLDGDNFASAQQALAVFEGVKDQMREQLLDPTDRPDDYVILMPEWAY